MVESVVEVLERIGSPEWCVGLAVGVVVAIPLTWKLAAWRIQSLKVAREDLKDDIAKLRAEQRRLQGSIAMMNLDKQSLAATVTSQRAERDTLTRKIEALSNQYEQLRKETDEICEGADYLCNWAANVCDNLQEFDRAVHKRHPAEPAQ